MSSADLPDEPNELTPEQVLFDGLLVEALGGDSPPDQSRQILRRLDDVPEVRPAAKPTPDKRAQSSSQVPTVIAVVVAATVLLFAAITYSYSRGERDLAIAKPTKIENPTAVDLPIAGSAAKASPPKRSGAPSTRPRNNTPPKSIQLAGPQDGVPTTGEQMNPDLESNRSPSRARSNAPARPMEQVAQLVSRQLDQYWDRIDVEPTPMQSPAKVAERFSELLGIELSQQDVATEQSLLTAIRRKENSQKVSELILQTMFSSPDSSTRKEAPELAQIAEELANIVAQGGPADKLLAKWLRIPAKGASTWSQALQGLSDHEALVQSAAVLLGKDIRCQRCHDLQPSSSNGQQSNSQELYWNLASKLAPYLGLKPNGDDGWYFDALNGQRRFIASQKADRSAQTLALDPRNLATGLVDMLWRAVHGRPLIAHAYDLRGAVPDESLVRIQDVLVDDLLAHQFDLSRSLALVMRHSPLNRQAPEALSAEGMLVADDSQWQQAITSVESFAAPVPMSYHTDQRSRFRMVQLAAAHQSSKGIGKTTLPNMLAQPITTDGKNADGPIAVANQKAQATGMPMRQLVELPAWLRELPDFESRVRHISHLATVPRVDAKLMTLASAMKAAGMNEDLILRRLGWVLQL